MTDQKTVKCDRCGMIFYETNTKMGKINFIEDRNWDVDEWEKDDICPDCYSTLMLYFEHVKEFDDLAEKLAKKDADEEDKK